MRPLRAFTTRLTAASAALLAAAVVVPTLAAAQSTPPEQPAAEDTPLISHSFDAADLGPWQNSGGEDLLEFTELHGDTVLRVNRAEDFHGIQSPQGLLAEHRAAPGDVVVYSAEIMLDESLQAPLDLRWIAHDDGAAHNYQWGTASSAAPGEWTTVTSEFQIDDATDLDAFRAYLGTPSVDGLDSYPYYIRAASVVLRSGEGPDHESPGEDEGQDGNGEESPADSPEALSHDFEDADLGPWGPRYANGEHRVEVTDADAHQGDYSAVITERTHQGQGIGADATEALAGGVQYEISAALRFAEGEEPDTVWFSAAATTDGSTSYSTLGQLSGIDNDGWTVITQQFTAPTADQLSLYFETTWDNDNPGNTSTFYIDDIRITRVQDDFDSSLTALKDTVTFPLGVAIDERETSGTAAGVVGHHFDRVTPENHLKPEAWFSGDGTDTLRLHSQAEAILDYAAQNELGVYGHVLVWHSQTPDWFFRDETGQLLPRERMDARMEEHIEAVARTLAERYGPFGSAGNPVVAYDVVNEVIADGGEFADGMRRSDWYQIYGDESYVDAAFRYADKYFNDVYAADDSRPVALYINDYNTELSGKRERMISLVERLLERGVPVDGFAHQFHLNLSMPISALEQAFQQVDDRLPGLPQLVTELDITVGDSVTEGALINQAYHYRDAFRLFRQWEESLDSVAIWGLTDGRSWRAAQAPLLFNDNFTPKPAYYGAIDAELPAQENRAVVFYDEAPAAADEPGYWDRLPLLSTASGAAEFQFRWNTEGLSVYVDSSADEVTLEHEGTSYELTPQAVTQLSIDGLSPGSSIAVNLRAGEDSWINATLVLAEELSYHRVPEAEQAPELTAELSEVWEDVPSLLTETEIMTGGREGAQADVRLLHHDGILHVLAEITDPHIDVSASDPWVQDSVEFFLDIGNERNGPYRTAARQGHHLLSEQFDFQFRISAENQVSVGTGDEQFQLEQIETSTATTEEGYIVQAAIDLREYGEVGSLHGFDVQVNDSHEGTRLVTSWADPTGNGYQNTERWGVIRLLSEQDDDGDSGSPDPTGDPTEVPGPSEEPSGRPDPTLAPTDGTATPAPTSGAGGDTGDLWPPNPDELSDSTRGQVEILTDPAVAGQDIEALIGGDAAGENTRVWLFSEPADLGTATADADGVITVTLPADSAGEHRFAVYTPEGEIIGWTEITVSEADTARPGAGPTTSGSASTGLASTGATIGAILLGALTLLGLGALVLHSSRRRQRH